MRRVVHSIHPGPEVTSTVYNSEDDVDVSLIEHNMSLTIADRIRQHDRALAMVNAFRRAGATNHFESVSNAGIT
jgi:hypothetical protein